MITGYYGLGNIGDEAILSGIINSVYNNINGASFSVVTNNPIETKYLHKVEPIMQSFKKGILPFAKNQIVHKEFLNIYRAINSCDVFILGGGELLQDLKPYYLPILLSLVYLAKRKSKKVVIYGIGAGPIETDFGKKNIKYIIVYRIPR